MLVPGFQDSFQGGELTAIIHLFIQDLSLEHLLCASPLLDAGGSTVGKADRPSSWRVWSVVRETHLPHVMTSRLACWPWVVGGEGGKWGQKPFHIPPTSPAGLCLWSYALPYFWLPCTFHISFREVPTLVAVPSRGRYQKACFPDLPCSSVQAWNLGFPSRICLRETRN